MKINFVPYDIAVKLKEKGFPMPTNIVYATYKRDGKLSPMKIVGGTINKEPIAPNIEQVLKWLREEKNIHIEIWWQTQYTAKNLNGFQFIVTPICENPQCETDLELYCDYETAALKGIEYVINNLI